jgi:hypothetical protein
MAGWKLLASKSRRVAGKGDIASEHGLLSPDLWAIEIEAQLGTLEANTKKHPSSENRQKPSIRQVQNEPLRESSKTWP